MLTIIEMFGEAKCDTCIHQEHHCKTLSKHLKGFSRPIPEVIIPAVIEFSKKCKEYKEK